MKILHIIPTYKPAYIYGGPIFSVSLLCENLVRADHEVLMLTTTANGPTDLLVEKGKTLIVDGVPVIYYHRYTKDHSHFSPALIWHLFRHARRYDAVHIHSWWNIPVICSVFCCWLRGVRPVLSPRGMLSGFTFDQSNASAKGIFHRTVGKFLLKKTRLHLTSEAEQQETTGIGTDSFVLPNFIQTAVAQGYRPSIAQRGQAPFTLIFLSRIHPKKNLENLIKALGHTKLEVCLKIAGMGEEAYIQSLKQLALELGVSEKITWLGELHHQEKFKFYEEADLFVLPSFNENFANVVIEALSTGTPVLVSEEVGLADYVRENGLGWSCPTQAAGIAAKLEEVFYQKEKLESIRQHAPATIEKDFSPKALTEKYVAEYKKGLRHA